MGELALTSGAAGWDSALVTPANSRPASRATTPSRTAGRAAAGSDTAALLAADLFRLAERARQLQFADEERERLTAELRLVHIGHRNERERLEREISSLRSELVDRGSQLASLTQSGMLAGDREDLLEKIRELEGKVVGAERMAAQGVRAARAEREIVLSEKANVLAELDAAKADLAEAKKQLPLISLLRTDRDRLADDLRDAQARVRELSDEVFELRSAKEARDAEVLGLQERMQRVVLKSDVSSVRTELAAAMAAAAEAEAQVQRLSRDVAVLKNKAEQAEEARGRTEADLTAARAEISVNEAAARALGPLRAERDRLAAELRNTQEDFAAFQKEFTSELDSLLKERDSLISKLARVTSVMEPVSSMGAKSLDSLAARVATLRSATSGADGDTAAAPRKPLDMATLAKDIAAATAGR